MHKTPGSMRLPGFFHAPNSVRLLGLMNLNGNLQNAGGQRRRICAPGESLSSEAEGKSYDVHGRAWNQELCRAERKGGSIESIMPRQKMFLQRIKDPAIIGSFMKPIGICRAYVAQRKTRLIPMFLIPEGRAIGSFRLLNLHHDMGITIGIVSKSN